MPVWLIVLIIVICVVIVALIITGVYTGNFASYRYIKMDKFLLGKLAPSDEAVQKGFAEQAKALMGHEDADYEITSSDGIKLRGYLLKGDPDSDVYVFCSHGYRDPNGGFEFAEKLPIWKSRGYNIFLVDHRAHAKSGGKFISFGEYESDDCIRWLNFMKQEFGENIRIILHGQSMGAAIVLQTVGKPEELPDNVKVCIEDCGYTTFYDQCHGMLPVPRFLEWIILNCGNIYLRWCHRIDMKRADSMAAVKRAKIPILFIHGEKDTFVPCHMAQDMYEAYDSKDKQLELFKEGTHCSSYYYEPERYTRVCHEFTDKYL